MYPEDAGNDKLGQSLPVSSTIERRPWPSKKVSEAEEMVKYMSRIPKYLQCEKNKCNVQEKALNVGVLDWGRLQKWSDHEKSVASKMLVDSASITNPSSLSSTTNLDSSPHSSRGNTSYSTERRQSSALDGQRSSKSSSTSDSRSSAEKVPIKGRRKDSSKHLNNSQATEVNCLPSDSAGSVNFSISCRNATTNVAKLDVLENPEIIIEQENCRSHPYKDGNRSKQSTRKHLEEIIARSMSNFDASLLDQEMRRNRSIYAGTSLHLSSAPPSNAYIDELHGAKQDASFERGREGPPIFLPRVDLKGISGTPLKSISGNFDEAGSRSNSRGRRSPMRQFLDQPQKSSSSVSSVSDITDVIGGSSSRGRRSPVKQILDPLLNSSIPDVSGSRSTSRSRRSPLRQMFESPRRSSSSINSSQQQPHDSCGIVDPPTCNENSSSDSKNPPSIREALLKLSWKNGLPLLMFSSSDDSILVAMMLKGGNSDMNICDCVYEIHTASAVEVKKKNGAWLSQVTKSKKPEFTCKFVAELIVSSSKQVSFDHAHCSFTRELVLLGNELAPTNQMDSKNLSNSELAAIVIKCLQRKSPSSSVIDCIPQVVVLLPSNVHGLSNIREPSKLIERWESGGSCDCGGWDEGCALAVLTNDSQEMNFKSVEDCGATNGTSCRFDLFTEGDARRGKHSFRMRAFKEHMFTVEFKASIHLLQAFAISIAVLHDRNTGDGVMRYSPVDMDNFEDISFDSYPSISS